MSHTPEYYESLLERTVKDLESWRNLAKFQVGTAGYDREMELLRADRDRWKAIATAKAEELLAEYQKAEASG